MKVDRRVQVTAVAVALGLVVVAVGPRTSVWPARLGGPDGSDETAAPDAVNAAQVGEVTDDPAEVPPDLVPGAPDADLLQRAEDARTAEPEATRLPDGSEAQPQIDPDTLLVVFDADASSDEIADALDDAGLDGEPSPATPVPWPAR